MKFTTATRLGAFLSKEYAPDFFSLLLSYQDISASEAASRLGLHIRTAQEFLDGLAELDILTKQEVYEKKRPYFRYSLKTQHILIDVDLTQFQPQSAPGNLARRIREKANVRVNFSLARGGAFISHVTFWVGDGRESKERKISLTNPQGLFLFHLPFPNADFLSILDILHKAGLDENVVPEILDIVDVLEKHGVIEALAPVE
jgi:hypothetical protein